MEQQADTEQTEPANEPIQDAPAPDPKEAQPPVADAEQAPPAPEDAPAVADAPTPPPDDAVLPTVESIEDFLERTEGVPVPQPVNPLKQFIGRGGVYIMQMGGCLQMVACTLVDVMEDGSTRIRLTQAAGVKASEIVAPYSEMHVGGTWHWA